MCFNFPSFSFSFSIIKIQNVIIKQLIVNSFDDKHTLAIHIHSVQVNVWYLANRPANVCEMFVRDDITIGAIT